MNLWQQTATEFGRSIGLDQLNFSATGAVVLDIQSMGQLAFEPAGPNGDNVLLTLTRPLPATPNQRWTNLLSLTHYRSRLPLPVQVGIARDQQVLAVVLTVEDFTLPKIHEVIQVLDRQHRATEERQ
jgi:type III secretion system chaperone SycN